MGVGLGALPLLWLPVVVACGDKEDESDSDWFEEGGGQPGSSAADDTGSSGDEDTSEAAYTVTWGASSLALESSCSDCTAFGIVETDPGCWDNTEIESCWTGEDCLHGYVSPVDGEELGPYCHQMQEPDFLELLYGGDPTDLAENQETVFTDDSWRGHVTFYVEHEDGSCEVGGAEPWYYDGMGCDEAGFEER